MLPLDDITFCCTPTPPVIFFARCCYATPRAARLRCQRRPPRCFVDGSDFMLFLLPDRLVILLISCHADDCPPPIMPLCRRLVVAPLDIDSEHAF